MSPRSPAAALSPGGLALRTDPPFHYGLTPPSMLVARRVCNLGAAMPVCASDPHEFTIDLPCQPGCLGPAFLQSMRDLGLESLGAQLSLLGRQVASSLNSILPPGASATPAASADALWAEGRMQRARPRCMLLLHVCTCSAAS